MCDLSQGRLRQQINFLRRQFLQEGALPLTDILSEKTIAPALGCIEASWNDRIYTPLITLWVFTETAVLKLDTAGSTVLSVPIDPPSQQGWLGVFDTSVE